jgi:hypothetical protein
MVTSYYEESVSVHGSVERGIETLLQQEVLRG